MADYTNDFSLKFKEGTTLDFPTYSIAVPDGFEAKTNVDGRDFVIYKRFDPDGEDNMTDEDLLYTEIKLSHTPQQVGLVVEGDCTTQHTADVLTAVLFPHGGRGGSLRRFKTDLSVGFIEPWDNSFYITIVLNKSIFRMWLLVQDPAYFDDPTGEFPEFSEKNLKDIEKMIKKWVSTIQSKESAEDDEPVQVDTERMRELETTLGDTISNALRKDAEDAVHSLPAVIEMLQGIDATHMRGVRGLSNRIQAATRESKALHHIRIEIDTEKSWIGVYGRASSVRINRGETTYWVCDAAGDKTRYVVEKLIKETKKLTADRVYLDLLKNVDYNRQQGYEISVEGVRGAIFPRQEEPQIGTRKGSSKSEREESSAQGSAGKKANTPEPVGAKGKSPKTEAAVPPSKNNPRRFVQVVECANPQSWVEKKPDAMEQIDTYNSFKYCSTRLKNDILKYIEQMPLNCEVEVDGKTYLLIHGAPTDSYDPMSSMYRNREEHAVWTRLDASFVVPKGKTLVFGHTPTIRYMPVDPEEWYTRRQMMPVWFGKSKIGIDCGCAYPNGGRLACLRLDDMRVFYSSYMDDEKGDSTE